MSFKEIVLLFLFGIIVFTTVKFQIYLSKKKNPLYGLILPIISFCTVLCWYVLFTPVSFEISENFSTDTVISQDAESDETAQEEIPVPDIAVNKIEMDHEMMINSFIITVITGNIGTIILLIIYWSQRRKCSLNSELKQMQLEEL